MIAVEAQSDLVPKWNEVPKIAEWTDSRLGEEIRAVYAGVQAKEKSLLYLGYLCCQLRDRYASPGRRTEGHTFASALKQYGIPRTSAHRAIVRYEESQGLRTKKDKVPSKPERVCQDSEHLTWWEYTALLKILGSKRIDRLIREMKADTAAHSGTGKADVAEFFRCVDRRWSLVGSDMREWERENGFEG